VAKAAARLMRAVSATMIDRSLGRLPVPRILQNSPGKKLHRLADHLVAYNPAEIYLRAMSMWPDPGVVVLRAHEHQVMQQAMLKFADMPDVQELAMLADLTTYLPDDILTKVDRASMAVGLEARVPLLDHRIIEFAWRLPLHFKVRKGITKWALRQVLHRYVPQELLESPKMGFGVPIDLWLRGPLREWAEDLLSPESLSRHSYFSIEPIRKKWEEHVSGVCNWQHLLWPVLMFQAWIAQNASAAGGHVDDDTRLLSQRVTH
jgi:asparagine synthase (glutamine-hydrolysing)